MKSYILKYNTGNTIDLVFYNPTDQTLQGTITWASGDIKIIKDGVDAGNSTNTPLLVSGRKTWRLALTASELSAKTITIEFVNANIVSDSVTIQTYGEASASIESIPATIAVGAIASDAITSSQIADNAITAGKIASNAITSAKIADNTITSAKLATDSITSAQVATGAIKNGAIASAELENIAKTIFNIDLAGFVGEASRSLKNAVRFLRNKWSVSGAVLTVTKEDDATPAWTANISTTAGADPVTGVDPS